jgi:hypothetical protein
MTSSDGSTHLHKDEEEEEEEIYENTSPVCLSWVNLMAHEITTHLKIDLMDHDIFAYLKAKAGTNIKVEELVDILANAECDKMYKVRYLNSMAFKCRERGQRSDEYCCLKASLALHDDPETKGEFAILCGKMAAFLWHGDEKIVSLLKESLQCHQEALRAGHILSRDLISCVLRSLKYEGVEVEIELPDVKPINRVEEDGDDELDLEHYSEERIIKWHDQITGSDE